MLLRELEHAVKYHGAEGPGVHVDAGDLASVGIQPIVNDVIDSLQLQSDAVLLDASTDVQRAAADCLARLKSFFERRGGSGG